MHECKSMTLTEHRHNVRSNNLINATSCVKVPITNNKGRFENRVDSGSYHDSSIALRINFTYTVLCITHITTSVDSSPPISMMDIKP